MSSLPTLGKMKKRLKIADGCPCHFCLTLAICIKKPLVHLIDTCPILSEWVGGRIGA
jgi:hypothetical protein